MQNIIVTNNSRCAITEYKGTNIIEAYKIYKARQICGEFVKMYINGRLVIA